MTQSSRAAFFVMDLHACTGRIVCKVFLSLFGLVMQRGSGQWGSRDTAHDLCMLVPRTEYSSVQSSAEVRALDHPWTDGVKSMYPVRPEECIRTRGCHYCVTDL